MDTRLDQLFDVLNRELFAGRLPKHQVRMHPSARGEYGWIDARAQTIWLCDPLNLRQTLLHEMCHIGTPGHGRRFRAKLRQLARRGEAWAQAERAYYFREEMRLGRGPWLTLRELVSDFRGGVGSGLI
jgi:hypothetical protein